MAELTPFKVAFVPFGAHRMNIYLPAANELSSDQRGKLIGNGRKVKFKFQIISPERQRSKNSPNNLFNLTSPEDCLSLGSLFRNSGLFKINLSPV